MTVTIYSQNHRSLHIGELDGLGIIFQCTWHECGYRAWRGLPSLPQVATVSQLEKAAVCSQCGHRGATVEVVERVWTLSGDLKEKDRVNSEHAQRLKDYIAAHPFGRPKSGRASVGKS